MISWIHGKCAYTKSDSGEGTGAGAMAEERGEGRAVREDEWGGNAQYIYRVGMLMMGIANASAYMSLKGAAPNTLLLLVLGTIFCITMACVPFPWHKFRASARHGCNAWRTVYTAWCGVWIYQEALVMSWGESPDEEAAYGGKEPIVPLTLFLGCVAPFAGAWICMQVRGEAPYKIPSFAGYACYVACLLCLLLLGL